MRCGLFSFVVLVILAAVATPSIAAEDKMRVEFHSIESGEDRCRATFVLTNKTEAPVESFKLDLVMFRKDGAIDRRVVVDLGPIRGDKTMVRTFTFRSECNDLGELLVNDVTACAPQAATACLDGLMLTSRVQGVRFYK